jgi:hypothetical protein
VYFKPVKPKRALRLALICVLLLGVAGAVGWWRLPALIESRIEGRLADAGYPGSRLRVESVGLRQLKLSALSIPTDSWRLQIREGTVDYRALELLRPEVRAVRFDGVRFELDLEPIASATPIAVASAPSWIDRSRQALAELPVRAMFITNGLIHVHRADQELDLPFDLRLTNDASMRQLRAQAEFHLEQGQWAGHRLDQAAVDAAVTVAVTPSVGATASGRTHRLDRAATARVEIMATRHRVRASLPCRADRVGQSVDRFQCHDPAEPAGAA